MPRHTKAEVKEARENLLRWLKPGGTVYTVLRHVSKSGMLREIGLVLLEPDGPTHPNWSAGVLLGYPIGKHRDGLRVSGCGEDMGHHIVYSLSAALWPNGFGCIGEKCPSNDHSNGDRNYGPHGRLNGPPKSLGGDCSDERSHWHRDGGYALQHRWL